MRNLYGVLVTTILTCAFVAPGNCVNAQTKSFAREGVTELSGSIVTTNLRDQTAMIYWVPKSPPDAQPYVAAFYASGATLLGEKEKCELEIRPAGEQLKK